jgi:hypothetical protein
MELTAIPLDPLWIGLVDLKNVGPFLGFLHFTNFAECQTLPWDKSKKDWEKCLQQVIQVLDNLSKCQPVCQFVPSVYLSIHLSVWPSIHPLSLPNFAVETGWLIKGLFKNWIEWVEVNVTLGVKASHNGDDIKVENRWGGSKCPKQCNIINWRPFITWCPAIKLSILLTDS